MIGGGWVMIICRRNFYPNSKYAPGQSKNQPDRHALSGWFWATKVEDSGGSLGTGLELPPKEILEFKLSGNGVLE